MDIENEGLLKDIVEHDVNNLFYNSRELYQFVYDTLMHNYSSYTEEELKVMHNDIFN